MAWGSPLPASVTAKLTPEQEQQLKVDAENRAFRATAQKICNEVDACSRKAGGFAASYPDDDQYSLDKAYKQTEVMAAYELWKQLYAGRIVSLNVHMMGPAPKITGDRNGQVQANFIRNKDGGKAGRYNVHVDVSD